MTVLRYGPLGASVQLVDSPVLGLILQDQIEYWTALQGRDPEVGEVIVSYVQKIREDGKLDIALRPVGYDKVTTARSQIIQSLEKTGALALGSKSSPEDIWKVWPGMSKAQYKAGVGALLREGAVVTGEYEMTLVPVSERVVMAAQPYTGGSPRGWFPPEGTGQGVCKGQGVCICDRG